MKFTSKLILLCAGLVTLTGLSIAYFVYVVRAETVEARVMEDLREHSSSYMKEIDRLFFERLGDIQILASDPLLCTNDTSMQQISARLMIYRNTFKVYISLSYVDKDGIFLADSSGLGVGKPQDPESFLGKQLKTIMTSNVTIDVGHSKRLLKNILYFAKPVQCAVDDAPRGFVVTRVDLARFHHLFDVSKLTHNLDTVEVDLTNSRGLLLYSNHNRAGTMKIQHDDSDGDDVLNNIVVHAKSSGYLDFKGNDWLLKFRILRNEALASAIALRDHIIAISLFGIGGAMLLAFFLARRFTQPIQALVDMTKDISSGNLSYRAHVIQKTVHERGVVQNKNEWDILTQSFNQMIMDLNALTVSREYVDNIILSMTDLLIVVSEEGMIERVNRPDQLGYDEKELIGQPVDCIFSEDAPLFGFGVMRNIETSLIRKDGQKIPVLVSGSVLCEAGENMAGGVLVAKDIRAFKVAQQKLREKETQLLEAQQMANKIKSEFLATMSHEIRTPMNAVMGLTDLALQTHSLPKTHGYLSKIKGASFSLMRIVNDILDFSKIEAGKLELESVDFLLRDVFDHVSDLFRRKSSEKNIELIACLDVACWFALTGDYLRLQQILINLVDNALKFTHEGEVELQVGLIESKSEHVLLKFSVRDTGIGLNSEQITGLFNPFVQADSSTTRKYGGTGLGLTICKRLVNLMGGDVWVESVPEQGSVFFFTAEFKRRPEAEQNQMVPPDDLRNLRVLIVDDNLASRHALRKLLTAFTFTATAVQSGQKAITTICQATEPYPLLLVDWAMPSMNGTETAQQIVKILSEQSPDGLLPKIIMLTSSVWEKEIIPQAKKAGVDAFLTKPVNCSLLFDTIMEVFGKEVTKVYRSLLETTDVTSIIQQIGGARVLLVEDNSLNREVARGVLENVGVIVEEAHNGQEAVQMAGQTHYDAILMDIQMPLMDGIMATQKIRQDQRCQMLPIIAMTAHAMEGDQEKSLASGMSDYVTKPINNKKLYATLAQWINPTKRDPRFGSVTHITQTRGTQEGLLPPSLDGFDLADGLVRFDGNQTQYKAFLLVFLRDYANAVEPIQAALRCNDRQKAARLAHTMQGVAGNISAKVLQHAALDLEQKIKQGQMDANMDCTPFEQALEQTLASIRTLEVERIEKPDNRIPPEPSQENQVSMDKGAIKAIMVELAGLLDDRNTKALPCLNTLKSLLTGSEWPEYIQPLEDCITWFDYQGAHTHLEKISRILDVSLVK